MAQYTPNFNLYEPDSSDDFADFRTEFNNNMNIIDQNLGGGGGSGGHTIIDENGQSMTQRTGLEFTGNVQVTDDSVNDKTIVDILGGGGNVYGFAIDESRKLFEGTMTNFTQTLEYTATEDAIALVDYSGSNGTNQWFLINGVTIPFQVLSSGRESFAVPIRKGDKISARHTSDNEGCFFHLACYGIKQGTNGIYAPVIYSDNERVIGVWRDNKPLYQRTFVYTPSATISTTTVIATLSSEIEVKDIKGVAVNSQNDRVLPLCYAGNNFGTNFGTSASNELQIEIYSDTWGTNYTFFATVQYTKTTDVAGSGNWNTDGIPTHHYSTSEQVVGTWTNGKPCYEITLEGSGSYASNIEHIISIPINADNVRIMSGFVDIGTDWLPISLTLGLGTGTTNGIYCYPNKSNGLHLFSSAWTFTNYSIVIQYTKTTD